MSRVVESATLESSLESPKLESSHYKSVECIVQFSFCLLIQRHYMGNIVKSTCSNSYYSVHCLVSITKISKSAIVSVGDLKFCWLDVMFLAFQDLQLVPVLLSILTSEFYFRDWSRKWLEPSLAIWKLVWSDKYHSVIERYSLRVQVTNS